MNMGAEGDFEYRRQELGIMSGRPHACVADEEVVASYLNSVGAGGAYREYLQLGQLGVLLGDSLFVHGQLIGQFANCTQATEATGCWCVGKVPFDTDDGSGAYQSYDNVAPWLEKLNAWCSSQVASWIAQDRWTKPPTTSGYIDWSHRGGAALIAYASIAEGTRVPSVVTARFLSASCMPIHMPEALVAHLNKSGVRKLFVGHTPVGNAPTVISQPGLTVTMGDTSYSDMKGQHYFGGDNRGQAVCEVLIKAPGGDNVDGVGGVELSGQTQLSDQKFDFKVCGTGSDDLVGKLSSDAHAPFAKAALTDGTYLLCRIDGHKCDYTLASKDEAAKLIGANIPMVLMKQKYGQDAVEAMIERFDCILPLARRQDLHHFLARAESSPQAPGCPVQPEYTAAHILEFLAKLALYAPEVWYTVVTGMATPVDAKNDYANIGIAFDASSRLRRCGIDAYHWELTRTIGLYGEGSDLVLHIPSLGAASAASAAPISLKSLPAQSPGTIRVVCISDTHLFHSSLTLPEGDMLVHAGDLGYEESRSLDALSQFRYSHTAEALAWMGKVSHFQHRVMVGGNHDYILEQLGPHRARELLLEQYGIRYLHTSFPPTTIQLSSGASVKVWGSGVSPMAKIGAGRAIASGNHSFQVDDPSDFAPETESLRGVDIMVVHSPPAELLLGGTKGLIEINDLIGRVKPALFVCGHAHNGTDALFERFAAINGGTIGVNASVLGTWNHLHGLPIVVDIAEAAMENRDQPIGVPRGRSYRW